MWSQHGDMSLWQTCVFPTYCCMFIFVGDDILGIFAAHCCLGGAAQTSGASVQQDEDFCCSRSEIWKGRPLSPYLDLTTIALMIVSSVGGRPVNWSLPLNLHRFGKQWNKSHPVSKMSSEKGFLNSICFTELGIKLYVNWLAQQSCWKFCSVCWASRLIGKKSELQCVWVF